MERLGRIEEVTADGRAIISCYCAPGIGDAVFDSRSNRIGTVGRVFGPVDGPYASVTPDADREVAGLKGTEVFFKERQQNGKNKRRNRRD